MQPLRSVDLGTHEAVEAHIERSDVCAVPAAAVVAEAVVALALADAALDAVRRRRRGDVRRRRRRRCASASAMSVSGTRRARGVHGRRQDAAWGQLWPRRLGLPFVDTDELIVRAHGAVAGIFAERGEAGFREIEREVVAFELDEAARSDRVVSLGGGAVTSDDVREALRRLPHVVWLDAPAARPVRCARSRVRAASGRRRGRVPGALSRASASLPGGGHPRGAHRRQDAAEGRGRAGRRGGDRVSAAEPIRVAVETEAASTTTCSSGEVCSAGSANSSRRRGRTCVVATDDATWLRTISTPWSRP